MSGEISPIAPPSSHAQSQSVEERENSLQGKDERIVAIRQSSESDKLREAARQSADEQRQQFQKRLDRAKPYNSELEIEQHAPTGDFVYHIIERATGEEIRQWPREDMLKIAEAFRNLDGHLVDQKV